MMGPLVHAPSAGRFDHRCRLGTCSCYVPIVAHLRRVRSPRDKAMNQSAPASGDRDAPDAELNLRIVTGLARNLREQHGEEVLASVAAAGGRQPEDLDGQNLWVSHESFERMLAAARELIPDETAFRDACAYKIEESYGPMVLFFWALSPGAVYEQAARAYPMITTISSGEVVRESRTSARLVYRSNQGREPRDVSVAARAGLDSAAAVGLAARRAH